MSAQHEPESTSNPPTAGAGVFAMAASKQVEQGNYAVDIKNMDRLMNIGRRAICKVETLNRQQGTGALYEVDSHGIRTHVFITCNHVLATSSWEEVSGAVLDFRDLPLLRSIHFDRGDLLFVWTMRRLDVTVVEFSSRLVDFFKSKDARFLKIGKLQRTSKEQVLLLAD